MQEGAESASRSFKENCMQWRRPIAEVALYAQMNEFTLQGIYHFKGTRFLFFRLSSGRQIGEDEGDGVY